MSSDSSVDNFLLMLAQKMPACTVYLNYIGSVCLCMYICVCEYVYMSVCMHVYVCVLQLTVK